MKNYTKKQFLDEVTQEIENIKKFATCKEKQNLNFFYFNPYSRYECIYGQLAGSCESDRAIDLIKKCCKRYCKFNYQNRIYHTEKHFLYEEIENAIDGNKMPDNFILTVLDHTNERNFDYISLLEAYINLEYANNENVLSYIKGETDELVL